MQLYIDPGYRKNIPNVEAWFLGYVKLPQVAAALGHVKLCTKALNPAAEGAKPQPQKQAKGKPEAPKKEAAKEDDDDLDLFGDDDEDTAAAAKAAAEAAKAKKKKEKPPEMSLIIFEVKPLDDTTNLDTLAERIFSN